MKPNLDTIRTEIEQHLHESGMAVFYGQERTIETTPIVYWDGDHFPDFKLFVNAAQSAGVKLIVFHQTEFTLDQLEDALEQLEGCEMPREEYKELERRLTSVRIHEGLVCAVQLSFDNQGRTYLFELRTDWFEDFSDAVDEVQLLCTDVDEDDTPIGGYFSKN